MVQPHSIFANAGKQRFQTVRQMLYRAQIYHARRTFQAVGTAKRLIHVGGRQRTVLLIQVGQDGTNTFQVLPVLYLERRQQFLVEIFQTTYLSTDCFSCWPKAFKLAAAFSNWRVLPAV